MNKIIISTDSTADLSELQLKQFNIEVLPLYVTFGEDTYKDGIDINTEMLYKMVKERKELPKTQAIPPGDFVKFFKKHLDKGYEIVHITIGSKISGTYQSALIAKDLLESNDIYVIDSQNLSSGIGLLALKASSYRNQNMSAKMIYDKVNSLVPKVRSQFAIKTLDYLHKGGRASGMQALLGSVLNIKPIIKVTNGTLDVYKKSVGKMSRALDIMLDELINVKDEVDLEFIFITHSIADKSYKYMYDIITKEIKAQNLLEGNAGCVISSHCGEGTIGVLYIMK